MTRARIAAFGRATATLAGLATIAGCDGKTGTYSVTLVAAPGSHVLDAAVHAQLVLTDPHTIVESDRGGDGSFALDIDVPATGTAGHLVFQASDQHGAVVAWGRTPPLPIAAVDASIRIFVAPPMSITTSPTTLDPPRVDMGTAPVAYGQLFAGGTLADGTISGALEIYDAYDHNLQHGGDLPKPRTRMTVVTGATGLAYLYGGHAPEGIATSNFWRFDSRIGSGGQYLDLTDGAAALPPREGADGVAIGAEAFLVTGEPPIVLDGVLQRATTLTTPASIGGRAIAVNVGNSIAAVFVGKDAGPAGAALFTSSGYADLLNAPVEAHRTGHGMVGLTDGVAAAIGGADDGGALLGSAVKVDATLKQATLIPSVLTTARKDAAIASNGAFVIVAGGVDGTGKVLADAEILDGTSLTPIEVLPLAGPRTGAIAADLPNGQILIAGGRDAAGAPIATIELFSPKVENP